jgi:hypothetical protein
MMIFDIQFFAEEGGEGDGAGAAGVPVTETDSAKGAAAPADTAGADKEPESLLSMGEKDVSKADDPKEPQEGEKAPEKPNEQPLTIESLKAPEGQTWDAEAAKPFLDLLNRKGIDKETAQGLVDMYAAKIAESAKANEASLAETDKLLKAQEAEWRNAALKDKEYGGDSFEGNIRFINAGRDKLSTPGAVETLKLYGLDNHPDIVRMFYRAGKLLGEDSGKGGKTETGQSPAPGEGLYQTMKKSLEGVMV